MEGRGREIKMFTFQAGDLFERMIYKISSLTNFTL